MDQESAEKVLVSMDMPDYQFMYQNALRKRKVQIMVD